MRDLRQLDAQRARQLAREYQRLANRQQSPAHARAARAYERLALAHGRAEGRVELFSRQADALAALASFPDW